MTPVPLHLSPNYRKIATDYTPAQQAMLTDFAENGFLVIDTDFDDFDALVEEAKADLEGHYNDRQRVQDAWKSSRAVKTIATNRAIMDTLELLYGRKAFPFQTLNFNVGTQQKTHSDTVHFDSLPRGFMAGVWVALEDVDAENGPLQYYPGSHRLHHLDMGDLGARDARGGGRELYADYERVYEPAIEKLVADQQLEPAFGYLRKGQALIWAANLLHGGAPITDPARTRYSQVTHYFFDGCAYHTPMGGDKIGGYSFLRQPWDITTGGKRNGTYGGEPIASRHVLFHHAKRMATRLVGRLVA